MADERPKEEQKNSTQDANSADVKSVATAAGKGKQMLLAGLLLAGLVVGSASAAVVVADVVIRPAPAPKDAPPPEPTAETEKTPCEFVFADSIIVNVYQTQQRRYLSVKPVLVLDGKDSQSKVTAKHTEVQHMLISILKTKTLDQLDDPDAPNVLGREIQEAVNLKLDLKNGVTKVYFTQFVVQ